MSNAKPIPVPFDPGCEDCGCSENGDCVNPADAVREWLTTERCKPGSGLTAAEISLIERCAEDLE